MSTKQRIKLVESQMAGRFEAHWSKEDTGECPRELAERLYRWGLTDGIAYLEAALDGRLQAWLDGEAGQ